MGHTRLGAIPTTRKWKEVAQLVAGSGDEGSAESGFLFDDIEQVAAETLNAARAGLGKAVDDIGLQYTFYLLTQVVLSARESDWPDRLTSFGVRLAEDATLFDLTAEVQGSIDDYVSARGHPSDVSEMAQQAAGEAIAVLAGPKANTLFGSGREELQVAVRDLSTKAGFARLSQAFFGRFMARFLNFYLSRVTAANTNQVRLQQVGDLTRFNEALQNHCHQSARILHDFSGEWYSKTEFQRGINLENTSGFMAVALRKLQAELDRQGNVS